MSDKLTPRFATLEQCEANKPTDLGKKKLYCVTLPTPEAYAEYVKTNGLVHFMYSNGYADSAYQMIRHTGGSVGTSPKENTFAVELAATAKAKAEAEAKVLELMAQIQALQARPIDTSASVNVPSTPTPATTPETTPATTGRRRN